jgi:hypothetical protein
MQTRRREELTAFGNKEAATQIPLPHWHSLQSIKPETLQRNSGGLSDGENRLILNVLNREIRVTAEHQRVEIKTDGSWVIAPGFLAFVSVVYLINAAETALSGRWVSEKDLSCASFFRGVHQLPVEGLLERFGSSPGDFLQAAQKIGGVAVNEPGDAAVRLWVFPRIPVKLILWSKDDVLPASTTVLLDYSIEKLLPADGILGMVRLVCDTLVEAGRNNMH